MYQLKNLLFSSIGESEKYTEVAMGKLENWSDKCL